MSNEQDQYPTEEIERRRDEVIRRMANTPPQPRVSRPSKTRKRKAEPDQQPRKSGARKG